MRISELSAAAGVPVPTIKYYLREGLLPEGERTSATQAVYGTPHVQRLRVIRALLAAGVSIAEARRVVHALDAPPPGPFDLLGIAHAAVTPRDADQPADDADETVAGRLYERLGGRSEHAEAAMVAGLARACGTLRRAGFAPPPEVLSAYVAAARSIAEAEIDGVPLGSTDDVVQYVVLGTVLTEPLILALRRAAQQIVSSERFGAQG